ncbi:MAG: hypothetical protein M3Y59_22720 [Myxococcota bacterium]|nr:hypothetical protein [Myxococcota bacterium]
MQRVPAVWRDLVAQFFGIGPEVADGLLSLVGDPSCWIRSRVEGISVVRIPLADRRARGLLARGPPGTAIPPRPSQDLERLLVLQGMIVDVAGSRQFTAGSEVVRPPGPRSPLHLAGSEECIFGVWVGPPTP